MWRFDFCIPVAVALGFAAACGGTDVEVRHPTDGARIEAVVISETPPPASIAVGPNRRVLVVERQESAAERSAPALARARTLATGFEHPEALAAVGEAQRMLEAEAASPEDYAALHQALAYRALIESNLDRPDRSEQALRAAARLRPDAELDEVNFPPDIRERYAELTTEYRAEQPAALAVTTEPSGALVYLDGVLVGEGPASVSTIPGQHYLRVEAIGHQPRVLAIQIEPEGNPPFAVELPRSHDEERVALQLLDNRQGGPGRFGADGRAALARTFASDVVALYDVAEASLWAIHLPSGETATAEVWLEGADRSQDVLAPMLIGFRAQEDEPSDERSDESGTILESPWFWGIAGVVLAAGAGVGLYFALTSEPDPVLRVREQ